jgi:hypothetical protein
VHGGGLSAAKRDSLLAEYAVGCRHHVLIGASFTTICQADAVELPRWLTDSDPIADILNGGRASWERDGV